MMLKIEKTLIAIPTYNEAENIANLITKVISFVSNDVDIVVVDDGSKDGTASIVKDLMQEIPGRVFIIERPCKMGLGTAYLRAFEWGLQRDYDCFFEMDADFSHNPQYLPGLIGALSTYDVVIGSRYVKGGGTENWGFIRKVISRGGGLYARIILNVPINDLTGGFNGWRRSVLLAIDLPSIRSEGYSFQIEMKYRAFLKGFSLKELPICFADRKLGHSKMSGRIVLEAVFMVLGLKFKRSDWKQAKTSSP